MAAEDLDTGGARIGAVIVLENGETLRCRLLSLSREEARVDVYYAVGGDIALRGAGETRSVLVRGEPVPGDVVAVEREGIDRTAVVRRSVAVADIKSATFHRSGSEASLGLILSTFVGPAIGAMLALII